MHHAALQLEPRKAQKIRNVNTSFQKYKKTKLNYCKNTVQRQYRNNKKNIVAAFCIFITFLTRIFICNVKKKTVTSRKEREREKLKFTKFANFNL